jgi:hypothetical protein
MAHPRAKLTVAGRRLLVERVLEHGWPPAREESSIVVDRPVLDDHAATS